MAFIAEVSAVIDAVTPVRVTDATTVVAREPTETALYASTLFFSPQISSENA